MRKSRFTDERIVAMLRDAERMGARARTLLCERYDKGIAFKAWLELLGEL